MKELNFEAEYKKLNKAQKEAVDSIYGPVMVVAGPGTGKTQIIGLRTANIILKTGINPENILITTFTEAGVIAIKKRLVKFLGTEGYKVKVSTFHAFCSDIISDFPEKFLEKYLDKLRFKNYGYIIFEKQNGEYIEIIKNNGNEKLYFNTDNLVFLKEKQEKNEFKLFLNDLKILIEKYS